MEVNVTTDDLSSILPAGTDVEDHIRESRAYEDIQEVDKVNTFGEVNMEASVTSDEVMRAGGFGATDGISNFLPVASDFTDFEANLRGAREYEDQNEEIHHPGLGWTSEIK
ncbi:hypothetical protein PHJA_001237600 [Phtheirospermum japonicum]|uniref:Uncharacterized protein n=1 Tax=Phtheirospermum japonicum TaxID=374723 RepID=A0A830BW06_9LAMI|nr:hypothetical protein PHJA_001237600 [Phtheirospermum japonicum]